MLVIGALDEHIDKHLHFAGYMLSRGAHDIDACHRWRVARHDAHQVPRERVFRGSLI